MSQRRDLKRQVQGILTDARTNARVLTGALGAMWLIEIVDLALGGRLDGLGIEPRTMAGLWGIPLAPFLHGGFLHLVANSLPFLLLGWLTMSRKRMDFYVVSVVSAVVGGFGTWLVGAPGTVHIGASGVVFGYLGFLLSRGIFEKQPATAMLSFVVAWLFGGMLWGLVPFLHAGVSWEGHLFGFLGGVVTARLLARERKRGTRR